MPIAINNTTTDADASLAPLCHIVTPVGMLGYGLQEDETTAALRFYVATGIPTAMILDSGSTDSGPDRLAEGKMGSPRTAYVRDLRKLLKLVHQFHVPLIFSSAGGDGIDEHVREIVEVIEEIAAEKGNEEYSFKTLAIFSNIDKEVIRERLNAGKISGCGACVPPMTEEDIEASTRAVAQMGPEPFIDAMKATPDFDVIVGGRAYDPAPYVAYCSYLSGLDVNDWNSPEVQRQFGGFTHMGKILECGGTCAEPKSHGATATVFKDGGFTISPLTPTARCTPVSVAAHTMYEKSRPDILHGPGGYFDLNAATYEQLPDQRSIRVRGSVFHFSKGSGLPYQIKLEAGSIVGFRSMFMGSFRDPILIEQLDSLINIVKGYAADQHSQISEKWELDFHTYGKQDENDSANPSKEIFIIGEALAPTQELATSIAATARIAAIHGSYPGQKATSGNFAFGIGGKSVIELGPCSKFSMYHLMDLVDGEEGLCLDNHLTVPNRKEVNGNGISEQRKKLFTQSISVIGKGDKSLKSSPISITNEHVNGTTSNGVKSAATTTISNGAKMNGRNKPASLGDLAKVVRSKNAGPYEITFDLIFESRDTYMKVKDSGMLSVKTIANAYNLAESDIVWCGFFDPAQAFKATIPRIRGGKRMPGGSFMENDVHGSQQHLALVNLKLPEELVAVLV
ncbi:uncharacterized protein GGS22DRAFT_128125 [Annulohypoxylon maeteangense]|uniref:uncharacterized protein n=1 Tax=Annulohypoxylon maeteangense TaxID=1927788 RepID=UPI002008ABA8|nr:uncharacterized protein GGS22DRAFT_128125 [Annulohypoxylon maeteangense]KAI0886380.1 hypothetical protein GGS22DRAFT_128125 [Annulohypoxylon maeteangense]